MTGTFKSAAASGVNILALGLSMSHGEALNLQFTNATESKHTGMKAEGLLRAAEAAHLTVYAACKWGHAAFDPIKVKSEELSPEVQAIYNAMAQA